MLNDIRTHEYEPAGLGEPGFCAPQVEPHGLLATAGGAYAKVLASAVSDPQDIDCGAALYAQSSGVRDVCCRYRAYV